MLLIVHLSILVLLVKIAFTAWPFLSNKVIVVSSLFAGIVKLLT